MASEVDIINDALGELGEEAITSRTEDTSQGKAANRFFDRAKLEFLDEHTWKFASVYVELARLAGAPNHKYLYSYQLPPDYIRLVELNETDIENVQVPLYEVVGDTIYTDETTVKIVYVANTDVTYFTPKAAQALSLKLASKMARLLTDSTTQKQEMQALYEAALKKAKSVDSRHQRQPIENRAAYSAFVQAHSGSYYPTPTVTETSY